MANIEIRDFRLSIICVETLLHLFDAPKPSGPLGFVGDSDAYAARFASLLLSDDAGPLGIRPPWLRPTGDYFWTHYLNCARPGDLRGEIAWKMLVPFRGRGPAQSILASSTPASWLPASSRIVQDAYYFPHGLAFVVTLTCREPLGLNEVAEIAHRFRRTGQFDVTWNDGTTTSGKLETLASEGLDRLRREAFGAEIAAGPRPDPPFTVFAVVRGEGPDPALEVRPQSEVHRFLEAVTRFSPTWKYDKPLPDLLEASIRVRRAPKGHLVYGSPRGRAVWFPAAFEDATAASGNVSCYHKNLTRLSLQAESLGQLVALTAQRYRQGTKPAGMLYNCAKRAAIVLGLLYGGPKDTTYRSFSPRRHIEQNGLAADINAMRSFFNLSPLKP